MTSSLPRTRSTTELYGRERELYHGQSGARNDQRAHGLPSRGEKRTPAIRPRTPQVYRAAEMLTSAGRDFLKSPVRFRTMGRAPRGRVQGKVRVMAIRGMVVAVLLLLLAGCSGGAAGAGPQGSGRSMFSLHVWDESLVGAVQGGTFTYWPDYPDEHWATVDIEVVGAVGLKALYFDLTYDTNKLEPVGVDFNDSIMPEDLRLEQIELSVPGKVTASETSTGLLNIGYTGSGKLARVLFRRK
jgi:hypothetical protein